MWEITLLGMPPSPNDKYTWKKLAPLNKQWREYSRLMCVKAGVPSLERVKLTGTVIRRNLGVADEDNDHARLKPIVDGLRDARVIRNDTRGYVLWGPTGEERGVSSVRLKIERVVCCTRCGSEEETQAFVLETRFCVKCYALLLGSFLRNTSVSGVEEFVREWLAKRSALAS